jgi:hypothetical protein
MNKYSIHLFLKYLYKIFFNWFWLALLIPDITAFILDWFGIEITITTDLRVLIAFILLIISGYNEYSAVFVQLNQFLENTPKISIGFRTNGQTTNLYKVKELNFYKVETHQIEYLIKHEEQRLLNKYEAIKRENKFDSLGEKSILSAALIMDEVVDEEEFREKLTNYLCRLKEYYQSLERFEKLNNLVQWIEIQIANLGNKAAKNLTISIIVQEPLTIPSKNDLYEVTEKPSKPTPPKFKREYFSDKILAESLFPLQDFPDSDLSFTDESYDDDFVTEKGNSIIKTYIYKELLASPYPIKLDEIIVKFPESSHPGDEFTLYIEIKSDDMPEIVHEELKIQFANES